MSKEKQEAIKIFEDGALNEEISYEFALGEILVILNK